MRRVVFLSSPDVWQRGHGPNHPLKPERLQRTHDLLKGFGAFDEPDVRVVSPRPATREELAFFHDPDYIALVEALSEGKSRPIARRHGFGPGDNPIFEGMFESERLKVGSALQAAELLVAGECEVAFSYSGGLHHGGPDFASGFCVFNDAAVAINYLLAQGKRVAYIDVDVHHGDGVQNAFYSSDRVLTISLHQDGRTLFPGTGFEDETGAGNGIGYNVNVPLPPFTADAEYILAFEQIVPPLVERFGPDIIVSQLGVDTHFRDPLANLALTTEGQSKIFKSLSNISHLWLALGGGGYDVDVVPRSWTLAFGAMIDIDWPEPLPESYREIYGGHWLRDQEAIEIEGGRHHEIQRAVKDTVSIVKSLHAIHL